MDANPINPHWILYGVAECATWWERAFSWGWNTNYFHKFAWFSYPLLTGFLIV